MNKRLLKKRWKLNISSLSIKDLNKAIRLFGTTQEKWAKSLTVNDIVLDCRYRISRIKTTHGFIRDHLELDDGNCCSAIYCCEPVPKIVAHLPIGTILSSEQIDQFYNSKD